MAYKFTITLSFSTILHNSTANSGVSFYVSLGEINYISTSLLNSLGGVGSVGSWVRGWHGSNFGVGSVGP